MKTEQTIEWVKKQGLEIFLDYASIGIILTNDKLEILMANLFACNLFQYDEHALVGKPIDILIPNRFHSNHQHNQEKYMQNPQNRPMGVGLDLFARRKDGSEFPVEISLGTYKIDNELYIIAFINDISIRKQHEDSIKILNADLEQKVLERTEALNHAIKQLKKQIKETEAAEAELAEALVVEKELNTLKSRFVSMASHEFRTPLSTISSSVYLLQKYTTSEDQPKRDKHLDRILSSVSTLNDILEDFLSVGKIEEGKVSIHLSDHNIQAFLEAIINQFQPMLKAGQQIQYTHTGPTMVHTDVALMRHIIMNLVSNARKFSGENSTIHIITDTRKIPWLLSVQDQGIGISSDDQKNLYDRFFRGNNATNIQGTGLGLHIVSKYTQILKGVIECESQLNIGTTFKLSFP